MSNKKKFTCKSEAQKKAIRRSYAVRATKSGRVEAPYPHFRYYRKSGHPALIVGEQKSEKNIDEYRYRKVMHSERDGRHLNEKVFPNPNPNDKEPMYIAKRVRHDDKDNFSNNPLSWKYK
ncbi:MAG: hypothetical protein LUI60_02050 [Clostridia bacterium]|nr:hypothetical protein [Clostridia bacterium]